MPNTRKRQGRLSALSCLINSVLNTAIADNRGLNLFQKFLPFETLEIGNVDWLLHHNN
jgi:hypothetical protein